MPKEEVVEEEGGEVPKYPQLFWDTAKILCGSASSMVMPVASEGHKRTLVKLKISEFVDGRRRQITTTRTSDPEDYLVRSTRRLIL